MTFSGQLAGADVEVQLTQRGDQCEKSKGLSRGGLVGRVTSRAGSGRARVITIWDLGGINELGEPIRLR